MKTLEKKKPFILAAVVALSAVMLGAGALGLTKFGNAAEASDPLPEGLNFSQVGEGGIDRASVKLAAESTDFQIWTARDKGQNICVISYARPEGSIASGCVGMEQFNKNGLAGSLQVGAAEQGDKTGIWLQTYLLPEGANAKVAADLIPGSEAEGQLVVRYGPIELERSARISVPSGDGAVDLQVIGKDSI